jgi:hypothetical protein
MPGLDQFLIIFIAIVAIIGLGWIIYDSRSDEEK